MKNILFATFSLLGSLCFAQEVSEKRILDIISTLAADKMNGRVIGTPENAAAAEYIASLFKENKLEYCTGNSYLVPFLYKGETAYNICGIKKGKSEKTLAFTGHFDHISKGNSSASSHEDTVYNGADDNASGIATLVGIADYFKNKTPEFSMIFMAFNGEEKGMLGSRALASDVALEKSLENVAALFNFEMLATVSQFGKNAVFVTGDGFSDLDELFNAKAANGLKIYPDPYAAQGLFYRSDNVSFVKKKIIAHSVSTVDMSKTRHYHQVDDDINIVDAENMKSIINHFAKTIEKLSPKNFAPKYNEKVTLE